MRRFHTFDGALKEAGGVTNGFDYLRLGLALYVLFDHCVWIPRSPIERLLWDSAFGPIHRSVMPMFFALSGFLVAGSYARNSVLNFVLLRALRIVPALAVEVTLSAIVIGMAFTTLPLGDYFTSSGFWSYFLNIVGDVHMLLPGVFDGMSVNAQLWTLPYEFECYLSLVILGLLGLARRRELFFALVTLACLALTFSAVSADLINTGPAAPRLVMVLSFLSGVVLFMFKEKTPLRLDLFAICALAAYLFLDVKNLAFLSPLPIAYITAFIGLLRLPKLPIGDISYGIYLFHYPLLCCLFFISGKSASPLTLFTGGLLLSLAFACASWGLVESPILRRKAVLLGAADRFVSGVVRRLSLSGGRKKLASTP